MKVHLSAIAGTAMASLAGLLREKGHEVTGSDQDIYPPMSTQLEALGIPVRSPYDAANVPADADLVVVGNALSRGNPEVEAVLDRKQRMASLPALLAEEFIRGRTSLVVAGTHGKTTTTSLLAFLLTRAGLDPSFLIGGVPMDFERSYRLGGGRALRGGRRRIRLRVLRQAARSSSTTCPTWRSSATSNTTTPTSTRTWPPCSAPSSTSEPGPAARPRGGGPGDAAPCGRSCPAPSRRWRRSG